MVDSVAIVKSLLSGGSLTFGISIWHIIITIFIFYYYWDKKMKYKLHMPKNWEMRRYIARHSPFMIVGLDIFYNDRFANNNEAYIKLRKSVEQAIINGLNKYDDRFFGIRYGFNAPKTLKAPSVSSILLNKNKIKLSKDDKRKLKSALQKIEKGV